MPHRVRLLLALGVAFAAAACAGEAVSPAIAFSYSFGDTAFEGFLVDELERARPEGGVHIRVLGGSSAFVDGNITSLTSEVRRATALANDPSVVVAVGPGGSREVLQVAPIYREAGLAEIVPTGTSRLLATAGANVFLMAANDSVQGEFIGAFADTALHARVAVIIHAPDEYGVGLAAGTAVAFAARGVRLIDRIPIRLQLDCLAAEGVAQNDAIAAEVALRGTPDVAVLATRTVETGCLARTLRARFPSIRLIAGDGTYFEKNLLQRAQGAAEGAYLVAFWHIDLDRFGALGFRQRFEARVGRRVRHGDAMFFDAVMIAASAIHAAGPGRLRVENYLHDLGAVHPAFEGITGPISFAPGARRTLHMTRVSGERSELVR